MKERRAAACFTVSFALAILLTSLLLRPLAAQLEEIDWVGTADGAWTDPNNWYDEGLDHRVPATGDDVLLDQSTLLIHGGALTVSGDIIDSDPAGIWDGRARRTRRFNEAQA